MGLREFVITFENTTVADANRYADDLREQLLVADETAVVERKRLDSTSMDFGPALGIILSAPVTVVLAKALVAWVQRNNQVHLKVSTKDGDLVADNLESKDASDVIRAFNEK